MVIKAVGRYRTSSSSKRLTAIVIIVAKAVCRSARIIVAVFRKSIHPMISVELWFSPSLFA